MATMKSYLRDEPGVTNKDAQDASKILSRFVTARGKEKG